MDAPARKPAAATRFRAKASSRDLVYGMTAWGGTCEIECLQKDGSTRQGANTPPSAGTVIRVVPVATLLGTCVASPGATVSSAAREQLPLVMVH